MAATVVQTAARGLDSSSQAHTVSFASPATAGNLLVVVYSTFGSQPSTPSGWSGLFWQLGGGDSIGVYYKTAAGGEQSAFINLGTRSFDSAFTAYEVAGWVSIQTGNPRHAADLTGGTSFTTSAITLATNSPLLLASFHIRDTAVPLAPASASSPFSNDSSADNGFNRTCRAAHYQSAKSATQTETATFTVPNSSYDRGCYALIEIEGTTSTDVTASGDIADVTVVALSGEGSGASDVTASGIVPNVRVIAMSGSSSAGDVLVDADLPSVTVVAMTGQAVGPDEEFVSEAFAEAIGAVVPDVQVSEAWAEAIGVLVPDMKVTEAWAEVPCSAVACGTRWAQFWSIARRDGQTFRFTSHDLDLSWGNDTYEACNSLNATASESASNIGSVGNVDLQGIVTSDSISEEDLFAGLFDDAYVEVWLRPWDPASTETPRRIAAGWTGQLSHGEQGFKLEVVGPGARLAQQPLVQVYTPDCRWVFGSPQCGVDKEAMALSCFVVSAASRASIIADIPTPSIDAQWNGGTVRFLYGRNAGIEAEVKTVDFATGEIVLWVPLGFVPDAGDDFLLLPGCDKSPTACKLYANYVNYGGFPDIPGTDAIMKTPDAKY